MAEGKLPARTGEEYATALAQLLPVGTVWPRDRDSALMQLVRGLAEVYGYTDARGVDLVRESLPWKSIELFEEYEKQFGLPLPCVPAENQTLEERRQALIDRLLDPGRTDPAYYVELAHALGYPDAELREFRPYRAGRSRCGSTTWRIGPASERSGIRMYVGPAEVTYFRAGRSRVGAHPQATIQRAEMLECLIRSRLQGHIVAQFLYTPIRTEPPIVDWFRAGKSRVGKHPQATIIGHGPPEPPKTVVREYFRTARSRVGRDPLARIVRIDHGRVPG